MFKTAPYEHETIWGSENWIVSTHVEGQSTVDDPESQNNGKPVTSELGGEFPQIVKVIQANDTLSVQVHPDDDYARRVENTYGKTECWYVLDAVEGASLICGLTPETTHDSLSAALESGDEASIQACLRDVPVTKGDFLFIPSGTVHAIKGGLRVLEVQEPSTVTYRMYDWGRKREMHIEKALQVVQYNQPVVEHGFTGPFSCPYFSIEKKVIDALATESDRTLHFTGNGHEFVSLFVTEGIAELTDSHGKRIIVQAEDTVMCPRNEAITVTSVDHADVSLLVIY